MDRYLILVISFLICFGGCLDAVPPRMSVLTVEHRDGYECRLIEYQVDKGERIKAYLLVPDSHVDRKLPALILLHDHGARFDIGKEKLVRPVCAPGYVEVSSRQWVDKYFDGRYFGDVLAASGYVVLVADALYWGDRSSPDAKRWSVLTYGNQEEIGSCHVAASDIKSERKRLKDAVYEGQRQVYDSLMNKGIVWAEKILMDDMASVKLLENLDFVDSRRIGAFGFSMGAHRCWLLASQMDRVKCGAAVCWMSLKSAYNSDNASDLSMRIPSMRESMDFPDIAMELKPRPMMFLSGDEDHLFPLEAVKLAFGKMNDIYSSGLSGRGKHSGLEASFFHGGHHCGIEVQNTVIDFFARNL